MQKMPKKRQEVPKGKKKYLNVVYFIDAHKTRSFKLSLAKLNIVFAIFCFILIWSLVSIVFVGKSFEEKEALRDHLYASLDTIFEYQSRYDGVYETAYPSMESKIAVVAAADNPAPLAPSQPSGMSEASRDAPLEKPEEEGRGALAPGQESQDVPLAVDAIDSDTARKNWPVLVEDITINKE